ncbi:MAG: FtsK/SpoIIIE domain-containing protein [Erysipelotrichaceae bacterium]|nr:FtsK/SpoIIIE domain-containing protein [Erysipelotrichaceae bacterium]
MYIVIEDGISFIRFNLDKESLPLSYKGIEILKKNEYYYLSLKKGYFFDDRDKVRRIEYKKYIIKHKELFFDIKIYVYKDDKGFYDYQLYENKPFIVAASSKANIVNRDQYLSNYYLYYKEKKLETNSDCLLLNGRLYKSEELKDGDEISFYNFIFYYYDTYLYINSFQVENKLPLKHIDEQLIVYKEEKVPIKSHYLPKKKEIVLKDIKNYEEVRKVTGKNLILSIGPSLTMSIGMFGIAGINLYNLYLNNGSLLNGIIYLLMPLTMLVSGIVWPLIANKSEKKQNLLEIKENKDKYLSYLSDYENKVQKEIDDYLKEERQYYFDGELNKDKLFYITDKSEEFLKVSIGFITSKYPKEYKEYEDEDVNEGIRRIEYRLNNIENCPYYISLLEKRLVSVISKKSQRMYLFKKFALELSSKYHYEDFYLALYAEDINQLSELYSLPQLMFNNTRLTLNKKRELQELNSTLLDKPLILLSLDKINISITNPNIHLLYFCNDINSVYKNSEVVVEYRNDGGTIYLEEQLPFTFKEFELDVKAYVKTLGLYQKTNYLNKTLTFKDIFKDIDVKNNYLEKQVGLRADFATISKEVMSFDLHESKQGPHGLIGGSTGSGKSELIVSMLLSLCFRYRPDYLNIILIDYKGGGIEESLSYKGQRLPHIVASVNNLENDIFERLILRIDYECKRRQRLFKELSNKAMTSIMNIDDYLDNNYEKFGLESMAHLLIVVDEFAELKKENPQIIKELISFSRIGRSLGIHLILATQRPSGSIDDEIWSNSRFKIALKVLSEKDSNDIIKSKEAAMLCNPGEFYLQVDGSLVKAKALYSKKDINNADNYEVALLDNRLNTLCKKKVKGELSETEASYLVRKIIETSDELNIDSVPMGFDKPSAKKRNELIEEYHTDGIILGEIDDYLNSRKDILFIPEEENALIISSRKNEINNLINSIKDDLILIGQNKVEKENIIEYLNYEEVEDIKFTFEKLLKENKPLTLLIEDISILLAYSDDFISYLYQLLKRNIIRIIAISKTSNLNFKLINSFKNKYLIETNDKQDLINIFSAYSAYKGNSFAYTDKLVSFVPLVIEEIEKGVNHRRYINRIPDIVKYEKGLIGIDLNNREKIYLREDESLLITSYEERTVEKYKEIYMDDPNISVELYDKKLKDEYSNYLWLGRDIYSQKLFYGNMLKELENGQGYLFKDNKTYLLKVVDNE